MEGNADFLIDCKLWITDHSSLRKFLRAKSLTGFKKDDVRDLEKLHGGINVRGQ